MELEEEVSRLQVSVRRCGTAAAAAAVLVVVVVVVVVVVLPLLLMLLLLSINVAYLVLQRTSTDPPYNRICRFRVPIALNRNWRQCALPLHNLAW